MPYPGKTGQAGLDERQWCRYGRLMHRPLLAFALLAGALAAPAQACGDQRFFHGVIHDALPDPLPAGTLIAEVEFEADAKPGDLFEQGLPARILRLVQGNYRGDTLIARTRWNSCFYPFTNGRRGLIVAIPLGLEDGRMVVDPIEVGRNQGFRLPDGFQIPPRR